MKNNITEILKPESIARVGLLVKTHHAQAAATTRRVIDYIHQRGWTAVITPDVRQLLTSALDGTIDILPDPQLPHSIQLMIVLGGDGTFLKGVRLIADRPVPILGINLGRLGFLTEITMDEIPAVFQALTEDGLPVQHRALLESTIHRQSGDTETYYVLNDVVIGKTVLARIIDLGVRIDGEHVTRLRADGLIIATPTGSTAYSMAASGSIVHPGVPCILLTPICPHTLTQRPILIPDTMTVDVFLEEPHDDVFVSFDGQQGTRIVCGDRVSVRLAPWKLRFVHHPQKSYFQILRAKLRWGEF